MCSEWEVGRLASPSLSQIAHPDALSSSKEPIERPTEPFGCTIEDKGGTDRWLQRQSPHPTLNQLPTARSPYLLLAKQSEPTIVCFVAKAAKLLFRERGRGQAESAADVTADCKISVPASFLRRQANDRLSRTQMQAILFLDCCLESADAATNLAFESCGHRIAAHKPGSRR